MRRIAASDAFGAEVFRLPRGVIGSGCALCRSIGVADLGRTGARFGERAAAIDGCPILGQYSVPRCWGWDALEWWVSSPARSSPLGFSKLMGVPIWSQLDGCPPTWSGRTV